MEVQWQLIVHHHSQMMEAPVLWRLRCSKHWGAKVSNSGPHCMNGSGYVLP